MKIIDKKILVIRSLLIAGSLTILKTTVGLATQSIAVMASAADSFMDLMISLINFGFIREANKPPDKIHPYGHGKIESLAGLIQSVVIAGIAIGIAVGAGFRFAHPRPIDHPMAGVLIMVIAVVLNWWHVRNLRAAANSTQSQVMATEYVHYASDFLSHLGVIVCLILFQFTGQTFWDPLVSALIVGYLLVSAVRISKSSLEELLDKQLPESVLQEIIMLIRHHNPKIIDFHDLRTRRVGSTKFIEFHVELRHIDSFKEAHDITEDLIASLRKIHPDSVITVHTDPEGGI